MMHHVGLETLTLAHGRHENRDDGLCLMEAVAWFAGKPHSDRPPCVSPVLGAYGRTLNDILPDIPRQELKQFIPRLPGTAAGREDENPRHHAPHSLVRPPSPAPARPAGRSAPERAPPGFAPDAGLP